MADLTRPDLEGRLLDLGRQVAFPPTPDLRPAVRERLAAAPLPRRPGFVLGWRLWPGRAGAPALRLAAAVALLFGLGSAALAVSPDLRTAAADRLGLGAVSVTHVRADPPVSSRRVLPDLDLGQRVSLDGARARAPYPVMLPRLPGFDEPDEVFVRDRGGLVEVGLVYRAREGLPPSGVGPFGLLLSHIPGPVDASSVGSFGKEVGPGARIEPVRVLGAEGLWIEGAPHTFSYRAPGGEVHVEASRLAGNTLLWKRGDLTLRLESALDKAAAIRIAEAVR